MKLDIDRKWVLSGAPLQAESARECDRFPGYGSLGRDEHFRSSRRRLPPAGGVVGLWCSLKLGKMAIR